MVKTVCPAVAVNACLRIILGSNVPEVESDSIQICPTTGLDGASAEYEAPFTSKEVRVVGAYVVPDDEYRICPEDGEVDVPVPPYCVATYEVESKLPDASETTGPAEVIPFTCSLFFTLKSLSDNLVHVSPNWYRLIISLFILHLEL